METKFNFKSSVCTSRVQSERLLALGLKKETADFYTPIKLNPDKGSLPCHPDFWTSDEPFIKKIREASIPAWSLDRLKELYKCVGDTSLWNLDDVNYDHLIQCIGLAIKHNGFNKEYLENWNC